MDVRVRNYRTLTLPHAAAGGAVQGGGIHGGGQARCGDRRPQHLPSPVGPLRAGHEALLLVPPGPPLADGHAGAGRRSICGWLPSAPSTQVARICEMASLCLHGQNSLACNVSATFNKASIELLARWSVPLTSLQYLQLGTIVSSQLRPEAMRGSLSTAFPTPGRRHTLAGARHRGRASTTGALASTWCWCPLPAAPPASLPRARPLTLCRRSAATHQIAWARADVTAHSVSHLVCHPEVVVSAEHVAACGPVIDTW